MENAWLNTCHSIGAQQLEVITKSTATLPTGEGMLLCMEIAHALNYGSLSLTFDANPRDQKQSVIISKMFPG